MSEPHMTGSPTEVDVQELRDFADKCGPYDAMRVHEVADELARLRTENAALRNTVGANRIHIESMEREAARMQEVANALRDATGRKDVRTGEELICVVQDMAAENAALRADAAAMEKLEAFDSIAIYRDSMNTEPGMEWHVQTGPLGPTAWGSTAREAILALPRVSP